MKLRRALVALAALAIAALAAGTAMAQVVLPAIEVLPEIASAEPRIYLGSLLTPASRTALRGVKGIDDALIVVAPAPGRFKTVEARDIRRKLEDFGITSDRYSVRVPDQIRVERLSQTVTTEEIQDRIQREVLPGLPWEDIRVEDISLSETIVLPVGKLEMSFDVPAHADLARPFFLGVDFFVNGQSVRRASLRTSLAISQTVPVLTRDLPVGERVTPGDVRWERRPLASTMRSPVGRADYFEGRKLRLSMSAGQVVTEEAFVIVPMIKRGDSVVVIFEEGRIRVSAMGQSLAAGSKGDRIRVLNSTSKKEIVAEVVDERTVKVVF